MFKEINELINTHVYTNCVSENFSVASYACALAQLSVDHPYLS